MSLRVVGAGVGRTGTMSLKLALERLLGSPCYHMLEVFQHPGHADVWRHAARGENVDWDALFEGFVAAVDWPAGSFWPELSRQYPDALVLLSLRDPEEWWESASHTIFPSMRKSPNLPPDWKAMIEALFTKRWGADPNDREASIRRFNEHNARVIAEVPRERLLIWRAGDGWGPIARALELPVPDEPFPRANTREDFQARIASHAAAEQ
ncbi:MAG TPA: sulfotransferase [Rhizomicrobium sp.]|nr:sulfotransferase [Rhizomicrobium sp.]